MHTCIWDLDRMSENQSRVRGLLEGFVEALTQLTVFNSFSNPSPSRFAHFVYLVSFPFVGAFFGVLGIIIVALTYGDLSPIGAWLICFTWLALTRASHAHDTAKTFTGLLLRGAKEDRKGPMLAGSPIVPGLIVTVILLLGKIAALEQISHLYLDVGQTVVFFAPIFSRWAAMLLAATSDHLHAKRVIPRDFPRGGAIAASTLTLLLLAFISPPLTFIMLVSSLSTALLLRGLMVLRTGGDFAPLIGATIECAEVFTLLIAVTMGMMGYDLRIFR